MQEIISQDSNAFDFQKVNRFNIRLQLAVAFVLTIQAYLQNGLTYASQVGVFSFGIVLLITILYFIKINAVVKKLFNWLNGSSRSAGYVIYHSNRTTDFLAF